MSFKTYFILIALCAVATGQICEKNEQYTTCASSSCFDDTCETINDPTRMCTMDCKMGCQCKEGFVRNKKGNCMSASKCAVKNEVKNVQPRCAKNERYTECASSTCFEDTCASLRAGPNRPCTMDCKSGCQCKPGFVRNKRTQTCVKATKCKKRKNKVEKVKDVVADPVAWTPQTPQTPVCGPVCTIFCEYGNVLDANGCPTCNCNPPPYIEPTPPTTSSDPVPVKTSFSSYEEYYAYIGGAPQATATKPPTFPPATKPPTFQPTPVPQVTVEWVTLPGGTQIKTIRAGKTGTNPGANDDVSVHYKGIHMDGSNKEFDSSYSRNEPSVFGVSNLIAGVTEALLEMEVGGKYAIIVPSEAAYGANGVPGVIGPNEDLYFEYELLDVIEKAPEAEWLKTAGGTSYRAITEGYGASPGPKDTAVVHYTGKHLDGTEFDSSYQYGKPSEFVVDTLITGVTEALQEMKVGGTYEVYVPASQAYGSRGVPGLIDPNEDIFFEYELVDIIPAQPSYSSYSQPSYSQPSYSQPSYSQPSYSNYPWRG